MSKTIIHAGGDDLRKTPTGIAGLDEITRGGLPHGRPTLVCGSAGCGKTLFGMEFLVQGVERYNEAGVFLAFEETAEELTQNVAAIGYDLNRLVAQRKLLVDYVHIDRAEIEETGPYDLEGLFVRLGQAIDQVRAKRVVLDTLEVLFSGFSDIATLRSELRRLFRWLKQRGVTAIVTAERGDGALTRYGMEEYISDCVILLDHRVSEQMSTRRLRIVKYRGSAHGTNEYPFLIDNRGFSVLPVTSMTLDHPASQERIPTGVRGLDAMFGGRGFYRGSSVLISGTAGTGKTTFAAHFAEAACRRGERVLYFAFEESKDQIARNMRSVGIRLDRYMKNKTLRIHSVRPTFYGLEMHLAVMYKLIAEFDPQIVIVDPMTNFISVGSELEVKLTLMRLIDMLKGRSITTLLTSLSSGTQHLPDQVDASVSSIMDTWLLLRDTEVQGLRQRSLYILKSRGMPHSNAIRTFSIGPGGVHLLGDDPIAASIATRTLKTTQQRRRSNGRTAHGG